MKSIRENFRHGRLICGTIFFLTAIVFVSSAWAVPTFQVYDGGTADSIGQDQESWFTSSSSFDLIVVGAYGSKTVDLTQVTLVVSAPQGQTGAITINGTTLLNIQTSVSGTAYYNPDADADLDILTNVSGIDGYSTKTFLPDSQQLVNNHYPFKDNVSDFVLFALGDFDNLGQINNYNADGSGIAYNAGSGQEKRFQVEVSGFDWLHFDVYGFEIDTQGKESFKTTWDPSPGSHDSTYTVVPAPGAVVLAGLGVTLAGWLRRRKA